jgi:hypothetical protein
MAKAAPKKITRPAAKAAKASRKPAAAKTKKVVKAVAPVKRPTPIKAPVVSKDELRVQLEKAQTTIATLRTKAREATRAAKSSAAQIAELEAKVAQLEKKSAPQEKPTAQSSIAAKPAKQRRRKVAEKAGAEAAAETTDPDLTDDKTPEVD